MFKCTTALCLSLILGVPMSAWAEQPFGIDYKGAVSDPATTKMQAMAAEGQTTIEHFFGTPFPETIHMTVAEDRAHFNAAFPKEWGMTETQCWMVGVGVADFIVVLSPSAWAKEACDHNAKNDTEIQGLVTHELTHVFHGQVNRTRDFTGMDALGWFVEGVAVLVSDQLTPDRIDRASKGIRADGGPTKLSEVWSGDNRYGYAGSLVKYVDLTYGRATTVKLLAVTSQREALDLLGISEDELLTNWKAWLTAQV